MQLQNRTEDPYLELDMVVKGGVYACSFGDGVRHSCCRLRCRSTVLPMAVDTNLHRRLPILSSIRFNIHCKKGLAVFPSPAGMSPNSPWPGII
jgi:hypothetical protein